MPYTQKLLILYWLGFLGWLVGSCILVSLGTMLVKTRLRKRKEWRGWLDEQYTQQLITNTQSVSIRIKKHLILKGSRYIVLCVGLIAGFVSGVTWDRLVQYNNVITYQDIVIQDVLPLTQEGFEQYTYTLGDSPKVWHTNICDTRQTHWTKGLHLDEVTFTRQSLCWNLAGSNLGWHVNKQEYTAKE